jgi:hypothetical protein
MRSLKGLSRRYRGSCLSIVTRMVGLLAVDVPGRVGATGTLRPWKKGPSLKFKMYNSILVENEPSVDKDTVELC